MDRDDLWIRRGVGHYIEATDADLAAMNLYRLEGIDVEALRWVMNDYDAAWPMGNNEIETLTALARQVLAVLDEEET